MNLSRLAACLPLVLLMGCSAYLPDFYYYPHPGSVQVGATQPSDSPPVSVFATVVGVRKADDQQHIPFSVEIRLRVDNNAGEGVSFDPKSIDLTAGDLQRFGPPVTDLHSVVTLEPGKSMVLIANFPFPATEADSGTDLDSLQLRWPMHIGTRSVAAVLNFHRVDDDYDYRPYYAGYWYQPYPVFRSVIVVRRR